MSYSLAGYQDSGNWTWQHWPPPFDQRGPVDSVPQGLGCTSCGGGCGDPMGLGQAGTGLFGTGLFAGGLNPSTWGVGEWAVVAIGSYGAIQVISSHPSVQRVTRKSRKAASGATSGIGTIVLYGALAYGAWWAYSQYVATPAGVSGFGDYQPQGFATPQILQSPGRTSQLAIPLGW